MLRRNFFATLFAPLVARWMPKFKAHPLAGRPVQLSGMGIFPEAQEYFVGIDEGSADSVNVTQFFVKGKGGVMEHVATFANGELISCNEGHAPFVLMPSACNPWEVLVSAIVQRKSHQRPTYGARD